MLRVPRLACAVVAIAAASSAHGQVYRNIGNSRFATVSNGPMQALVVDVPNPRDLADVRSRVATSVNAVRRARDSGVRRYLEQIRKMRRWKGPLNPGIPDIVLVRSSGRLVTPPKTRAGDITFNFPAFGAVGSWGPTDISPGAKFQADLQTIIGIVYPELKNVYAEPSWSGALTIVNGDNLPPGQLISDPNALSGGALNLSTNEIVFAQYNTVQTTILNLTQMLALAFRGPNSLGNDPWERGMARAATLLALRNVKPLLDSTPSQAFGGTLGNFNIADPLWNALDRYDLLNQPALGNDRFFPVSKKDAVANTAGWPWMLVPRLEMSGSAWLKVATEDPSFFRTFNTDLYTALGSNPGLKNNVPQLKLLARSALQQNGVNSVEGRDFLDWFGRQFVLDSSVSPGTKLFAETSPLRPETDADEDFSLAIIVTYFQTTFDGSGNSDEKYLAATSYPIYWDFTQTIRFFLGAQYERVDIRDGVGAVAPTFINIGSENNGRMRAPIDFPAGPEALRLYTAPRSMGKLPAPNNFWGCVVGFDKGKMKIEADGLVSQELPVEQGAFGGQVDPAFFTRPRRATLTFTFDGSARPPIVRRVNTGENEYIAVFEVEETVETRTRTIPAGLSMVSFPIRPLEPKAAAALLDPATDQPIFNEGNLLLAQWRQNLQGEDKYIRYPTLEPLQPGKAYWASMAVQTAVKLIGRTLKYEKDASLSLLHGWNQVGNPFEATVNVSDLRFQYLADNVPVDLATAVSRGWIEAKQVIGLGSFSFWSYNGTAEYQPALQLDPWVGYWVRVLVSEGLTVSVPNPAGRASRARPSKPDRAGSGGAWAIAVSVKDPEGNGGSAYFGQSPNGSSGFDAVFDAQRPPDFPGGAPSVVFPHPEWGANAGTYFSDIRGAGGKDRWELVVRTPASERAYTLVWNGLASLPRRYRAILQDEASGRRQYLHSASSYSFRSSGETSRRFTIWLEDRGRHALRIANVIAVPNRSAGAQTVEIAYELSGGAMVTTEIKAANGRVVRRLEQGRSAPSGTNRLLWDTRDDRAVSVASGQYLVQITARSTEGEVSRVVRPILLTR